VGVDSCVAGYVGLCVYRHGGTLQQELEGHAGRDGGGGIDGMSAAYIWSLKRDEELGVLRLIPGTV
jgi:hypothetical protein